MWVDQESPVDFKKYCSQSETLFQSASTARQQDNISPTILAGHVGRRLFTEPAKEKTNALQKIQRHASLDARRRTRSAKSLGDVLVDTGVPLQMIPPGKYKCDWDDCTKQFGKKEHLKRHVES